MKVSMVSEHASPLAALGGVDAGGQNVHVASLATALARRGVDITVHTRRDDPGLPRTVALAPRVTVDHVDAGPARFVAKDDLPPYMDAFAADLARVWERDRPDLVHAHFWMSGRAAVAAARPLGIPIVLTLHALGVVKRRHQGHKDTSPPGRVQAERDLVGQVDHIVATCTDEVFELIRMGAPRRRISVVPCGVDLPVFGPDGPAEPGPAPGRVRLLSVGRLVERKGIGNIVTALRRLPSAELVVAGGPEPARLDEDPEIARLRALAAREGVADRLRLIGRVEHADLPALYRSADIVVCVPWYEPFGMAAVEAMACGVPVVAAAVGGLVDTVVDGGTGLHVPPRSPERVAEAVVDLAEDPAWRAELGRRGARRARELFGWDRVAGQTVAAYHRLIGRPLLTTARPPLPAGRR